MVKLLLVNVSDKVQNPMTNTSDFNSTLSEGSAKFDEVPVVTVHKNNLEKTKSKMTKEIQVNN